MSGSLAGHTAAWPLPDVTNHALHAALHRAGLEGIHAHRRGRSGVYSDERDRKFGSLLTAGPFPVDGSGRWFFPRPKDTQLNGPAKVTLQPARSLAKDGNDDPWLGSSLPDPERDADGGAKSTHLAVPAGAIYYFEAEPDKDGGPGNAIALANALNWHGATDGTAIKNRRSTLLGEKGYGLGVCGTWNFHP